MPCSGAHQVLDDGDEEQQAAEGADASPDEHRAESVEEGVFGVAEGGALHDAFHAAKLVLDREAEAYNQHDGPEQPEACDKFHDVSFRFVDVEKERS